MTSPLILIVKCHLKRALIITGGRRLGFNSRPGQQMAVWGSVDVRKIVGR